ncbi:NAD(P)-binding protein [Tuber magnatum]|uniref:NAD(P)-binding protein n=1 Tax=Tuber magnatum TaxID=42249 RepID=A0A317T246_9PEZI|nr:NAD(P)-binding protein [Tuber magnatum]
MSDIQASTLFSAKGLVAVVTGGGTGIGLMIAAALENNGATKVYIVGRRKEVLENAARVHSKHGNMIPILGDVTSKESLEAMVKTIESEVGYVNLLVNNAGTGSWRHSVLPKPPGLESRPDAAEKYKSIEDVQKFLWEDSMEEWEDTFRVNVTGAWFASVAFLGLLDQGNKREVVEQTSQIITVTSIASFLRGLGTCFSYPASKAAMTHVAKMLATHFPQYGIRSNVIAPGLFPSELTAGPGTMDSSNKNKLGDFPPGHIPLRRPGKDEDIAGAVLYLAGRAGAYVNGNVMVVDGGRTSVLPATY